MKTILIILIGSALTGASIYAGILLWRESDLWKNWRTGDSPATRHQPPAAREEQLEEMARQIAEQQVVDQQIHQLSRQAQSDAHTTLKTIEEINRINRLNQELQELQKQSRPISHPSPQKP